MKKETRRFSRKGKSHLKKELSLLCNCFLKKHISKCMALGQHLFFFNTIPTGTAVNSHCIWCLIFLGRLIKNVLDILILTSLFASFKLNFLFAISIMWIGFKMFYSFVSLSHSAVADLIWDDDPGAVLGPNLSFEQVASWTEIFFIFFFKLSTIFNFIQS